jgi:hypothetical protein
LIDGGQMNRTLKEIDINLIRIDGNTQARVEIDANHIQGIVENMKHDIEYDPVESRFDGTHHWLSDGFHRYLSYKQLGVKNIKVLYLLGTQYDAQNDACGANAKHGKQRTSADKEKSVLIARDNPINKGKSNYELAKICMVSQPFVAKVLNPEAKKKQEENRLKSTGKQIANKETTNPISSLNTTTTDSGVNPDDEEMKATELAIQADQETMYKMLEADDALAELYEENKRLNLLNAQLQVRIHGLMNERNEAIKMVKDLQKQLDKKRA